jgi:putative phosphoribosyl transferase
MQKELIIPAGAATLSGDLTVPASPLALVLFVHGSGSSRRSPRNRYVAGVLNEAGLATLLFDLLTPEEEEHDIHTRQHRFDIEMLATRLLEVTRWVIEQPEIGELPLGYFGSSTGGGAALVAAARLPERAAAVVSRGGRPDLAGDWLPRVKAPTLLIVGGADEVVIELNQTARAHITGEVELRIVPGATHLFEEPGTLEEVARLAADWFLAHAARRRVLRES